MPRFRSRPGSFGRCPDQFAIDRCSFVKARRAERRRALGGARGKRLVGCDAPAAPAKLQPTSSHTPTMNRSGCRDSFQPCQFAARWSRPVRLALAPVPGLALGPHTAGLRRGGPPGRVPWRDRRESGRGLDAPLTSGDRAPRWLPEYWRRAMSMRPMLNRILGSPGLSTSAFRYERLGLVRAALELGELSESAERARRGAGLTASAFRNMSAASALLRCAARQTPKL